MSKDIDSWTDSIDIVWAPLNGSAVSKGISMRLLPRLIFLTRAWLYSCDDYPHNTTMVALCPTMIRLVPGLIIASALLNQRQRLLNQRRRPQQSRIF